MVEMSIYTSNWSLTAKLPLTYFLLAPSVAPDLVVETIHTIFTRASAVEMFGLLKDRKKDYCIDAKLLGQSS